METTKTTTAMYLTPLELEALQTSTCSDYYENGRESVVWDFSVYDICSIAKRSRSGVYSSLVQKGLIVITEKEKPYITDGNGNKIRNKYYSKDDHGTIYITETGYATLDQLGLINEYGSFI